MNVPGGDQYILAALFLLGLGTALLGLSWLIGWRARHWDARAFLVQTLPTEIRLSYGMGPVLQALIAFGFITLFADVVLALASGRGRLPSWAATVFTLICIQVATVLAVWAMRQRHASGKDDIVIDLVERQLRAPPYANATGKPQSLGLDDIQRIGTQRVYVWGGRRVRTIKHRVAANVRNMVEPVILADGLTEAWSRGLAGELGRLLTEANPRAHVPVDLTPVRLDERRN